MYNKAANIIFIMIHTGLKRMELAMPVYTNNEETKKTISLNGIQRLGAVPYGYEQLYEKVVEAFNAQ